MKCQLSCSRADRSSKQTTLDISFFLPLSNWLVGSEGDDLGQRLVVQVFGDFGPLDVVKDNSDSLFLFFYYIQNT